MDISLKYRNIRNKKNVTLTIKMFRSVRGKGTHQNLAPRREWRGDSQ